MDERLPDEISQLGRLLKEHPATYRRLLLTAIGWGIPISGFIGFLLWDRFGPNANHVDTFTMTLLVAGGILIWLFFTGMAAWESGPTVRVYERGFVFGQEPFPWESIDAFFQEKIAMTKSGFTVHTAHDYAVRRADGRKAKFYLGIERSGELAETIQQQINPRLLDAARREVEAGRTVDFGCAQLDKDKMRYKPAGGVPGEMSWIEFRDVSADGMQVKFRKQGAWFGFELATRQVANLAVMLSLIEELVAASRSTTGRDNAGK